MDELKKALDEIKVQLSKGVLSKEDFDNQLKAIADKHSLIEAKIALVEEQMRKRSGAMSGLEDEKKKFSLLGAIKGSVLGQWDKSNDYEKQVMAEYREKAMASSPDSAGGALIPPQAITDIIEMLRAETAVIKAGATVMSDLFGSPVEIPKQTGGATAYWVGENAAITGSDLTLGQLSMTPNQVAALVKLSNRLIRMSNPGAEGLVRADIAMALALAIDYAALKGSGSANQPRGVANTSSILTSVVGADGGTVDFTHLSNMEGTLEDANALRGNLAYIMHPKVKRKIKQMRVPQYSGDTGGNFVMLPMTDQQLKDRLGYNFVCTTQIPTDLTKGAGSALSEVYFANWRELIIAQWAGLQIETSNVAGDSTGGAFSSNQTWIRAIQEVDIGLRHVESFCLLNDAATT